MNIPKLPIAVVCPDFLVTDVSTDSELSERIGYCFEKYGSTGWRIFGTHGDEFLLQSAEERNASFWSRTFLGKDSNYSFSFKLIGNLDKHEIGEIILRHLASKKNWWWNNDDIVSLDLVRNAINESVSISDMFGKLGWFAPEVV
ncbi:hypothetical protein SAMN05421665_2309 [Yoonia rosea]|uniref:Uncharacterized protein n=1 Tax=Yoonia rosea TaxID=287098 RepID=A0A1R3X874_9RHOB|nr:hypothetical protein SAMN05421665_2309 [Yoonia rosea]